MRRTIRVLLELEVPALDERTPQEIAAAIVHKLTPDCAGTWTYCPVSAPLAQERS
jgi:hypothetical protein